MPDGKIIQDQIVQPTVAPPHYDIWGTGKFNVLVIDTVSENLYDANADAVRVSAFDLIRAVFGGSGALTYFIKKDGGAYGAGHTDAREEYLSYACADVGLKTIVLKVKDALDNYTPEVKCYVNVQDNAAVCGA